MKRNRMLAVLLTVLLLTACVPTPETDVVINRGEEDLNVLIQTTPAPDAVSIAEAAASALPTAEATEPQQSETSEISYTVVHLNETYSLGIGKAQVIFDADVTIPNVEHWAIDAVRRTNWTRDALRETITAMAGEQPIYSEWDGVTKAYLANAIAAIENSEKVKKMDEIYRASGEMTTKEKLLMDYESAPNSITRTPLDWDKVGDGSLFCSFFREDIGAYWNVMLFEGMLQCTAFDQIIQNEAMVRQGEYVGAKPGRELVNLSLSRTEAEEKAEAFLRSIGVTDVTLAESACEKAQRVNLYTTEVQSEGWILTYRKSINGLAAIAPRAREQNPTDLAFTQGWQQETLSMYVDSSGIWQFLWNGRYEMGERLSESAALLDYNDAMELIKQRLRIENMSAEAMGTRTVTVTDITLGYCIVPQKDEKDVGVTLPVWIVNYSVDASISKASLYFGFAISALNGANIHLE